jgi:hypothetical protein
MKNEQVDRPPLDPEALRQEIEDVFTFGIPVTPEQHHACQQIQNACKTLAHGIMQLVPEGKEQTIAINNLLGVALWSRHGITRRSIIVAAGVPWEEAAPVATEVHLGPEPTIQDQVEALQKKQQGIPGDNT